jgi:hypothetical protein
MVITQRPFLTATSSLSSSRKSRFSCQPLDFAVNFPSQPILRRKLRWSVLRMICGRVPPYPLYP